MDKMLVLKAIICIFFNLFELYINKWKDAKYLLYTSKKITKVTILADREIDLLI